MIRESKADLHVHSKYSNRPSEWFLRRIGAPESFVEPRAVYDTCRERGMDYVTISDHNCIDGALEIADLPGTFVSCEVTTYFPEDGCKVHCLVSGIDEKAFRDIQELRASIYDLQKYLGEKRIIHTIAHPLFRVNDRLTAEHFEKLILMFKRFEGINGARCDRGERLARVVFGNLTPELIEQLADRHGIQPAGPEPWKKFLTGGSDDHGGLYSAGAFTVTPHAATVHDFLDHLRGGSHRPGGSAGTSLKLAHSLYQISYSYYKSRFAGARGEGLIGSMLERLAVQPVEQSSSTRWSLPPSVRRFFVERRRRKLSEIERLLVDEFQAIRDHSQRMAPDDGGLDDAGRNFTLVRKMGQQLAFAFIQRFVDQLRRGSLIESLQSLSSLGPVLLGITPYLTAAGVQHKDEPLLREVAARFAGARHLRRKTGRTAWFTDTFEDMNGVSHTIRKIAAQARAKGREMTVVTCLPRAPHEAFPVKNFEPVGTFALPEYEAQKVVFPPALDILAFVEKEEFDEIIISTPGPVGLTALGVARLLRLDTKGIYHTDFPRYVKQLTEDDALGDLTWRYMCWFYGQMRHVYVPSRHYEEELVARGFARERLSILPRGVDLECFNPGKRAEGFWKPLGINGSFKFLYVGRVSKEKNLEVLLRAFPRLIERDPGVELVVVGDGPQLEEWKTKYGREGIAFTGRLSGEALAGAYANADVFVFPSMTDTFGNVVLEAHASGLPAIVSNCGGPAEIVQSHNSGLVVDARTPEELVDAMLRLRSDHGLREQLRGNALARARASRWEDALAKL